MRKRRLILFAVAGLCSLLILGNPSKERFLKSVADDFGAIHHGAEISSSELESMGSSDYQSYLLFSKYRYTFGSISVHYYGLACMTFYQGSSSDPDRPSKNQDIFKS